MVATLIRRWIRCTSARICTRSLASRVDSGSSIRNTDGSRTMARPIATRCRCPPDSWPGLRSSHSVFWNTIAMSRSLGVSSLTTFPPMRKMPLVVSSSPATIRSVVVLPQPDGPTRTMNSPSATSMSMSFTAWEPFS